MKQTKWFDRKFDFSTEENIFPSIIERLDGTPLRLEHKVRALTEEQAGRKPDGKWSIKENIGHLTDLEALWQARLDDLLNDEPRLRPADLTNTRTERANHNASTLAQLLGDFRAAREETLGRVRRLSEADVFRSGLHPRLGTPMRTMDHFLFVAEHDDHHLARISEIMHGL
jgi:uncharacterized damage-inducible protein DinB